MMTKEQQRIAIAEWMGFSTIHANGPFLVGHPRSSAYESSINEIPNYPEDLNAMHDAWLKLDKFQQEVATVKLYCLLTGQPFPPRDDTKLSFWMANSLLKALASQRYEALCRTLFSERFQ